MDLSVVPWYVWVSVSIFLFFSGLGTLVLGASLAKVLQRWGDRDEQGYNGKR